ncbi:MAG: DnaJ domain-containing protein [Nitrospinae bacterium]|nr:DnaJ domain-containing protein [Nitrospinota bacterium]
MIHLDFYVTLGVSPAASDEEIKKTYRKLVFQYHPDRNQGGKEAEEKIREINAAYEVLGDPEKRKSYERLRFGGYGKATDDFGSVAEETIDLGVVLQEMEKKLWDEGRRELFSVLIKNLARIKEELGIIREHTVAVQGYDSFREDIVKKRAAKVIPEIVTREVEERKERLLDVALQMMLSQGVAGLGDESSVDWVKTQLHTAYGRGSVDGYCEACELMYVRR